MWYRRKRTDDYIVKNRIVEVGERKRRYGCTWYEKPTNITTMDLIGGCTVVCWVVGCFDLGDDE